MAIVQLCAVARCGRYRTDGPHCAEDAAVYRAKDNARRNTHPRKRIYSDARWPRSGEPSSPATSTPAGAAATST